MWRLTITLMRLHVTQSATPLTAMACTTWTRRPERGPPSSWYTTCTRSCFGISTMLDCLTNHTGSRSASVLFFTQKLFHVLTLYDLVNQTICTPTPLPYVNMCRTLLAVYLLLTPFSIQLDLGWYANTVVPTLVAVSLLGLDQISTELENPFGDDPNDLDMLDEVGMVEHEAMFLLQMCGDKLAREHYVWKPMPEFVQAQSARPLPCYLAIRSQVDPTGPGPVLFDKYPIRKPVAVEHLIESSGDEEDGTDGGSESS
mmetsp:Transcript_97701/g.223975  ORF Transcript_97701/g.223975 Transcript_97701/m.223975 type:complete len:257 (+) Transcript_97701:680-1450(+)